MKTNYFREQVANLGGYDLSECGKVLLNGKLIDSYGRQIVYLKFPH